MLCTTLAFCALLSDGPVSQEVTYRGPAGRISALLQIPAGNEPFAAAVLVGGSGPSNRQMAAQYAQQLNDLGLATLIYDKRGIGQSEGHWTTASLQDLADDAAAGIAFLKSHSKIDPNRVGLWSHSQGGWVVPLVGTENSKPAFVIAVSGGGIAPRELELMNYQLELKRAGVDGPGLDKAQHLLGMYFNWLGSGIGREDLLKAIRSNKEASWYKPLGLERVLPSDEARVKWEWVSVYEPEKPIREMKMPVLAVFGSLDNQAKVSSEVWERALQAGGNRNYMVRVVPGMGHAAKEGNDHDPSAVISKKYLDILKEFIETYVIKKQGS